MTLPESGGRFNPPRVARAVVERVLPADVGESIAGDPDEFFSVIAARTVLAAHGCDIGDIRPR